MNKKYEPQYESDASMEKNGWAYQPGGWAYDTRRGWYPVRGEWVEKSCVVKVISSLEYKGRYE